MKDLRKILSFLLAAVMLMSLLVTAYAAGSGESGTYSITIENGDTGHRYEAYQILTGIVHIEANGQSGQKTLTDVQWGKNARSSGAVSEADLEQIGAGNASAYVNFDSEPVAECDAPESGKYVIGGLVPGYYLVRDNKDTLDGTYDAHTAFILEVVEDSVVSPKSVKPTVDKQVWDETADAETGHSDGWGETADHAINESFRFKLIATLPADENFEYYSEYTIVFTDIMSDGITFEAIESVTVGGVTLREGQYSCTALENQAGGSWTLTIGDLKEVSGIDLSAGVVVEVVYRAHLNENAKIENDVENKNTVYLEYSNNPNAGGEGDLGKTVEDHVWVFTYKVDNTKVDENSAPLAEAGFRLYTDEACTQEVALIYDENLMAYRPVAAAEEGEEMFSAEDGRFNMVGLDHGTYYLKETSVPAGYNACDDVKIVISATHSEDASGTSASVVIRNTSNTANTIINKSGVELPETGGTGTTFMYIAGGILVFVAVVLLVTKKKMKTT